MLLGSKGTKHVDQMDFIQQEINGLPLWSFGQSVCLVILERQPRKIKTTNGTIWFVWVELRGVAQWTNLVLKVGLFFVVHLFSKA
jgi:hypothetical protein